MADAEAVADAQAASGVVFLRDQQLTPDPQPAAVKRFGRSTARRCVGALTDRLTALHRTSLARCIQDARADCGRTRLEHDVGGSTDPLQAVVLFPNQQEFENGPRYGETDEAADDRYADSRGATSWTALQAVPTR